VHDVLLQRSRVMAMIGKLVVGRVSQHVRVHWKREFCSRPETRKQLPKPAGVIGAPRSVINTKRAGMVPAFAQRSQLFPANLVHAWHSVLDAPHVHEAVREIHLIPSQRTQSETPQSVSECNEDHCRVAQTISASAISRGRDQSLDFLRRQIFAAAGAPDTEPVAAETVPFEESAAFSPRFAGLFRSLHLSPLKQTDAC